MNVDALEAVADLARVLRAAELHLPRLYPDRNNIREPFDFLMFTRPWSDTSLGFGGIAGQAFTSSTVVVCWREPGLDAAVFVGGQLAYPVHKDDPRCDKFWKSLFSDPYDAVVGAFDWCRDCPHRVRKNSNVCEFCGRGQPL